MTATRESTASAEPSEPTCAAPRAYRLVTGPESALYGDDVQALREELHQIRFLLDAGY